VPSYSDEQSFLRKVASVKARRNEMVNSIIRPQVRDMRAIHWALYSHVNTRLQKMSFKDLPYLIQLYKIIGKTPLMVVEKAVQCGLSELFIIQSHIEAGEDGMTVMYILPKYELRNRFVNNRIYKLHRKVATYNRFVMEAETKVHRTSLMHFGKGTLAYVGSNVSDEFIEIPVDSAYVDEKDRCNLPNLLMVPDRLTASPYKYQREISNPTTEEFGIDERYLESSQGTWNIKCPHCGKWFVPDFFTHVVREIASNVYAPRDETVDPDPNAYGEMALIHDCGKPLNRLVSGEWIHEYPNREWKGFRVSKIFTKFTPLRKLYQTWAKAVGNDLRTQLFYNSDLGLPFSSKGSKLTRHMLDECKRPYGWPVSQVERGSVRVVGVDVGDDLHVVMRERVKTSVGILMRLIGVWVLPGFNQLVQILREWKPKCVVIDAAPEIHKVMDLKAEFGFVWSSRFQEGVTDMTKHKDKREVRMDRTALLDYVKQGFEMGNLVNPMQAESLESGSYYAHLMASTRILEANENHPEKSRFVWKEGSRPDHFFLAEAYCLQAGMIMPDHSVFDFFENESRAITEHGAKRNATGDSSMSDKEREDISRLKKLTPHVFLESVFDKHVNKESVQKEADRQRIEDVCIFMEKTQNYVDSLLASKMSQEPEEEVIKILLELGFVESRIKGQYVK
jgi:Phage terminase large subunit gpA, ATPase domain